MAQLALALAAGLLGLIANTGAPMLGSGLPMRLDVVIVLCVAIPAGPAWAALSATIATALVCWHAGHPTLMFVAVLEAVAIGSLVRRRVGIALASAGFWIAAGVPILYGWSAGILQADSGEAPAGALQQVPERRRPGGAGADPGCVAAGARLAGPAARRPDTLLRAQVFDSVIPLAVCPVIVLGLVLGRVVVGESRTSAASWSSAPPSSAAASTNPPRPRAGRDIAGACVGAAPVSDAEAEQMLVREQGVYGTSTKSCCSTGPAAPASAPASSTGGSARPFEGRRVVGDEGLVHRADADRAQLSLERLPRQRLRTAQSPSGRSARRS